MILSLACSLSSLTLPGTLSKETHFQRKEEETPFPSLQLCCPSLLKTSFLGDSSLLGSLCFRLPLAANGLI